MAFIRNSSNTKRKTGIPVLDKFITLENGSLILIKEDEYSYIHNYFLNTFLSEGIHELEKNLIAVSKNKCIEIYDKIDNECETQVSKMYIAWRYSDLKSDNCDSKYSLTSKLDYKIENILCDELSILDKLNSTKNQRVALYSLFNIQNVVEWLYNLKKAVRQNNHICMVSIPTFLYEKVVFDQFFDVVMSLDSNIFNNFLPNYKAVIHFEKINFINKIRHNETDTFKFGIKFSKDRLVIEKIDIPPEDIIEPSKSCAQF